MSTTTTDLDELQEALRGTELFEMLSKADARTVAAAGEVREYKRGDFLFRTEDAADCIHLLLDGAIEIVRPTNESPKPVPVAYVSPGELIGDMALFTGTHRRSDGRVPEWARVWTLTLKQFEQLAGDLPGYGMELAGMSARRLQDLITHMRRQARRKELAGKLEYFDMPTVVQTLITAGQTGLLTFMGDSGEIFAEVLLKSGTVDRARCSVLDGDEAFHEIFLHKDDGEFYFRNLMEPDPDAVSPVPITTPAMHLMMEAMRRADELDEMRERLEGTARNYRAKTDKLTWEDERTAATAAAILEALHVAQPLEKLRGRIPCSSYALYSVASRLLETGQIA